MAFSGALTLTDLNDFITPSQACIKPVEVKELPPNSQPGAASTEIQIDPKGTYYEVASTTTPSTSSTLPSTGGPTRQKLQKAEISLTDCLACSGCITSAESVLITLQSHEEVLSVLTANPPLGENGRRVPVLSVAPQVLASLAATLDPGALGASGGNAGHSSNKEVSLHRVLARVRAFAKRIGFEYVFDTSFARHLAHREHVREFEERSATAAGAYGEAKRQQQLPMLASACPGWVCYAEKTHGEMLPFMSATKSPQQIMGSIVKRWLGRRLGKRPDEIYHVAVMPCYDKKLEASRQDFYNEQYRTRDVDCVITTGELELLMREKDWDLHTAVEAEDRMEHYRPRDDASSATSESSGTYAFSDLELELPELLQPAGSSSGSWLQTIITHVQEREASRGRQTAVRSKMIRTGDYEDFWVEAFAPSSSSSSTAMEEPEVEVVFRGAKCYGFRNLQNVVRKVGREAGVRVGTGAAGRLASGGAGRGALRARRAKQQANSGTADDDAQPTSSTGRQVKGEDRPYDYVEVMACPAGCVNGGGQARRKFQARDNEGHVRNWEADGVINGDTAGMGARWGDREWVKAVEQAYWRTTSDQGPDYELKQSEKIAWADAIADAVLDEMCRGEDEIAASEAEQKVRRLEVLRTQYRAVVSEVIGLAVKW